MTASISTIRSSYIDLRGIYLGSDFVHQFNLESGKKYSLMVEGLEDTDLRGTLDRSSFVGGLAKMYRAFDLTDGDQVQVDYHDGQIHVTPPKDKRRAELKPAPEMMSSSGNETVCSRQQLKHIHISKYSPGSLSEWGPRTEPDVYMVFGALAEIHDYHYCCGASQELLTKLGYESNTKPDAIVIDDATDEYLFAEFKMRSSDFKLNHKPQDVDLLVCWVHDETDNSALPPRVLDLSSRLKKAIEEGEIEL